MFLHIGKNESVNLRKIIAIIDYEAVSGSEISQDFMVSAKNKNTIEESPKSFVITGEGIYYSPISSVTLEKRVKNNLIQNKTGGE